MNRERVLKIVLVLVGLIFVAFAYPIVLFLLNPAQEDAAVPMLLSLYVTLGVFMLLAARNPSFHRSLLAYVAWSSFAHGAVMFVQSFQLHDQRRHLLYGVALFLVIGIAVLVLLPRRTPEPGAVVDIARAKAS
jgi:hypothetical protein